MRRFRQILFLMVLGAVALALYVWREKERERKFVPEMRAAASRYGVDPLLVKAIVWRESRFDPTVAGRHGELGLMQLRDIAEQEWADAERVTTFEHEHCRDPKTNTLAGVFYLSKLLKRYSKTDDPVPYALADYNAGRSNVLKWNRGEAAAKSEVFIAQIGFPTTQHYVRTVMRRYALYRFLAKVGWS